jgi:two-component system, OmpR family, response regulator TrcR
MKVLIVEDERTLSMIISDTLRDEGFDVVEAYDGNQGFSCLRAYHPDVIIADVMMPNMDGFEMVRRIRKTDKATPVLFLTARSSIDDLVTGFKLGANDYLKKPFKMQELIIRVKALVKMAMQEQVANTDKLYEIGHFLFNPIAQTLSLNGSQKELSYMESEILKRLCSNIGNIVEIDGLLDDIWHNNTLYNRNSLHVFIHKLRHILAADRDVKILNVRGIGYKMIVTYFLLSAIFFYA